MITREAIAPAPAPAGLTAPVPRETARLQLARLARAAALSVPGVIDTDSGPMGLFVTVGGGQRLAGVVCAATASGRYEVSLRLACDLVPLLPLGEQVRSAVAAVASAHGVALERVHVHVASVAPENRC